MTKTTRAEENELALFSERASAEFSGDFVKLLLIFSPVFSDLTVYADA